MAAAPKAAPIIGTKRLRRAQNPQGRDADPAREQALACARQTPWFRLEGGPIRDRWFKDGRWHSVMLYGLIAGEER